MIGIFESHGIMTDAGDPRGARTMSAKEIEDMQVSQYLSWQRVTTSFWLSMAAANGIRPERPLDERFAEFKTRLAAALEKRRQ